MIALDPFYPVLPDAHWIERLVPLGIRLVQLRAKDMTVPELRSHIRCCRAVCAAHDCVLVINDHWRLAIEEGADFIHLGQEDLAEADLSAIRGAGLRLGLSTHDEAELATALEAKPDYVALGPIWPTVLKKMKWAPQTPAKLQAWRKAMGPLPLVAIGGITVERLPSVWEAGADSAAVVTDIVRHPDPEARTREWISATR
ncbi:thiamine-phosphate diphosphorylase [Aureimonas phyllosphaerae]|uniref:Thiamine-phosphate synthase n=1 Tax=Aureimonas phyllosphaerae TaxID=1166078 RepID=A0A7W6BWF2_9HYPH|nr:thiamine phosphate synthase [Aureimonas phyllosphaerae]MBB3934976.1 thiamine-phosphate pyrophosphorylase [Aureimonas phyllosphaerae]MBB3958984.1 thiamine-phosphate pyrophosphorylase [Aureimonas phyllosphaerae]SFF40135.1 thiamine-phosphate diphosphorylase [Aureimonas phyllosphaerae]